MIAAPTQIHACCVLVCLSLNLQNVHKRSSAAIEEALVWILKPFSMFPFIACTDLLLSCQVRKQDVTPEQLPIQSQTLSLDQSELIIAPINRFMAAIQ